MKKKFLRKFYLILSFCCFFLTLFYTFNLIAKEIDDNALLSQACSFYYKGDFVNSAEILRKITLNNKEAIKSDFDEYILLLELKGLIKHSSGNIDEAKQIFLYTLELIKEPSDNPKKIIQSRLYYRMGSLMLTEANIPKAKEYFIKSNDIAKNLNDKKALALSYYGLGYLNTVNDNYPDAISFFDKSLESAEDIDTELIKVRIFTAFSLVYLMQNDRKKSIDYVLKASELLEKAPDSFHRVIAYLSIVNILQDIHDKTNSDQYLLKAKNILEKSLNSSKNIGYQYGEIQSLGMLGRIYELEGDCPKSLELTRHALFLAQKYQSPDVMYPWQWQLGRLLYKTGEQQKAIESYRRALISLDSVKNSYMNFSYNNLIQRNSVFSFYLEFADLLLKMARQTEDEKFAKKLIFDAREIMEKNKIAELQDYFKDDCVVALQSKTSILDYISDDTAIIYPIVFKDRLELLVTIPQEGIKQYSIDITSEKLDENINNFRVFLEKRTTNQFKAYGKILYDLIIKPIAPDIEKHAVKNLVIVPDSLLRTIPLAALYDGEKYLVEKYAISVTPGLTLTEPRKIRLADTSILLGGITKSIEGFPPLPAVDNEVEAIRKLYNTDILKDDAFTKENIKDSLTKKDFGVVHIASHGLFQGNSANTFILAFDGRISLTNLQDLMSINIFRDKPIELLSLSACETAAGDDRAALGLAGVAVKAGARSAFATLWQVSDVATSELVSNFYSNLRDSHSKSEALQKAQISLIKDENFNHPYYWSPFLIIGNWL